MKLLIKLLLKVLISKNDKDKYHTPFILGVWLKTFLFLYSLYEHNVYLHSQFEVEKLYKYITIWDIYISQNVLYNFLILNRGRCEREWVIVVAKRKQNERRSKWSCSVSENETKNEVNITYLIFSFLWKGGADGFAVCVWGKTFPFS